MNQEHENTGRKCCRGGWRFIFMPICIAAGLAIFAALVMYLWNAVMPDVFASLKPITYWQALGILILAKILFGNFRRGGCGRGCRGRRHGRYWSSKWMNMTEEEKAKLKEEWSGNKGDKCC